ELEHPEQPVCITYSIQLIDRYIRAGRRLFFLPASLDAMEGKAFRMSLVRRYDHKEYWLSAELPLDGILDGESIQMLFDQCMKRAGTRYVDQVLVSGLKDEEMLAACLDASVFEFLLTCKDQDLLRGIAILADSPSCILDEILERYPFIDVVQIPLNYRQWLTGGSGSYEVAVKHGKPVIACRPLDGGELARPSHDVAALLPSAQRAKDALRFSGSHKGVVCVAVGISDPIDLAENLSVFSSWTPMSSEEMEKCLAAGKKLISAV
ncbi:MAG: hypothetical protein IJJ14_01790, partial [Coriobacteriales bacterium]|nr:hypothetical protein [Coriobacteriales bacterium]